MKLLTTLFGFDPKKHSVKTELFAGITTFLTMAYILAVNPEILSATGMDKEAVFTSTALAAILATVIMALWAKLPFAQASGMGLNAFFAYTICLNMGYSWQFALTAVFLEGIIFILLTVSNLRTLIVDLIPESLKYATTVGIGLFIAYLGLNNAGLVSFSVSDSVTPGMAALTSPNLVLAVIGLLIMVILMVMHVKGAILIGIVATTIIGIPMGVTQLPASFFSGSETWQGFGEVSFAFFGGDGIISLFSDPSKIPFVIVTIFSMCLSDTFDSIGTFIGTGRKSGIFDEEDEKALEGGGFKSRLDKALVADSFATSVGALFGTSNATTYVESSAGIAAGGRTGLTSLVTAIMFLICIPFSGLIGMVPSAATSPALIVVGILMVEPFAKINWTDFSEAVPAFFTVAVMSFTYGITNGIAAGFIMYCITLICTKKAKDIHPIIAGASILFLVDIILKAIG